SDPRAPPHYAAALAARRATPAACEAYRAGAHADVDHDAADRAAGRRIASPVLVLWGAGGLAPTKDMPLDVWRQWATDVRGAPIDSGHFLPEEAPDATAAALAEFFA